MRTARLFRLAAASLFVTAAAAVSTSAAVAVATPAGAATKLQSCGLADFAKLHGHVNISFWESASMANLTVLQGIVSAFNSSQSKVHVTLVTQAGYDDTWQKYEAGLASGVSGNIVQLEDDRTQEAIDTQTFMPVQSCINEAQYSTR